MMGLSFLYGRYGVRVFPCFGVGPSLKAPMIAGGFRNASADRKNITAWGTLWRQGAVPGLPCQLNGLIIIDADRHGDGVNGVAALRGIFDEIGFNRFSVPIVATPNNGEHYYFRRPEGLGPVAAKLAPGIDVRDNGYVIAAGAVFMDKRKYRLRSGTPNLLAEAIQARTLPELPAAIVERLIKPAHKHGPIFFAPRPSPGETMRRLEGIAQAVATATPGERNKMLHWGACRCGEMVRDGCLGQQQAFVLLMEIAQILGLPQREASATIQSGLRYG